MTMERMNSGQGRAEMQEEIDTLSLLQINQLIKQNDQVIKITSQRMIDEKDTLTNEELVQLTKSLHEYIQKDQDLRTRKQKISSRLIQ